MSGHVATAQCEIDAPPEKVWRALTDPEIIKKYMFGSEVKTDWKPGSPITWKGEFEGRAYEDKGEIISVEPGRRLEVTHFSPLTGQEDRPENYHRVRYDLQPANGGTVGTANPGQQQQCRGGRALRSQLANDARRPQESR